MIGDFFSAIIAKIVAVVGWFSDIFIAIFVALWDILKDAFSWLFDQCLSIAVSAVNAIDVSGLSSLNAWGELPSSIINILGLLGVGQAVTIISSAIGIRLLLQLIPFVRLGS